jgi:hypothetical protein
VATSKELWEKILFSNTVQMPALGVRDAFGMLRCARIKERQAAISVAVQDWRSWMDVSEHEAD